MKQEISQVTHFGTIPRPVHTALKLTVSSHPFSSSHQIRTDIDTKFALAHSWWIERLHKANWQSKSEDLIGLYKCGIDLCTPNTDLLLTHCLYFCHLLKLSYVSFLQSLSTLSVFLDVQIFRLCYLSPY